MYYSSATAICVNILITVSPPIKSIECYHYSCSRAHLFFHPGKNGESSRVETSQFFGTNPVLTCSSCHCLSAGIAICSTIYVPLFNSTRPSSKNFKHNLGMKGSSLKVGNGVNKTLKSKTIAPDNGKRRTVWTSRRKWISSTFSLGDFQSVILILSVRLVNYGLNKTPTYLFTKSAVRQPWMIWRGKEHLARSQGPTAALYGTFSWEISEEAAIRLWVQ